MPANAAMSLTKRQMKSNSDTRTRKFHLKKYTLGDTPKQIMVQDDICSVTHFRVIECHPASAVIAARSPVMRRRSQANHFA
jgi:hypothetical protein